MHALRCDNDATLENVALFFSSSVEAEASAMLLIDLVAGAAERAGHIFDPSAACRYSCISNS